jgi:hypothetical protein
MVVTAQNQPPLSTSDTTAMATGVQPIVAELPQPEEVHHRYLVIRDTDAHTVITTIEILSPANKIGREGRQQYEDKRLKVLGSLTNLVEIDLLRSGEPLPMRIVQHNDYRIVVSRSQQRPCADSPPPRRSRACRAPQSAAA